MNPGEPPYRRGIHADMYRGRPWTIRQLSGAGSPEQVNERIKFLLANGATGINLLFDVRGRLSDQQGIASLGRLYLRQWRRHHVGQWRYWRDPLPSLVNSCRCLLSGMRERLVALRRRPAPRSGPHQPLCSAKHL